VAIYLWNPFPRLDLRLGKGASFPQAWGKDADLGLRITICVLKEIRKPRWGKKNTTLGLTSTLVPCPVFCSVRFSCFLSLSLYDIQPNATCIIQYQYSTRGGRQLDIVGGHYPHLNIGSTMYPLVQISHKILVRDLDNPNFLSRSRKNLLRDKYV